MTRNILLTTGAVTEMPRRAPRLRALDNAIGIGAALAGGLVFAGILAAIVLGLSVIARGLAG